MVKTILKRIVTLTLAIVMFVTLADCDVQAATIAEQYHLYAIPENSKLKIVKKDKPEITRCEFVKTKRDYLFPSECTDVGMNSINHFDDDEYTYAIAITFRKPKWAEYYALWLTGVAPKQYNKDGTKVEKWNVRKNLIYFDEVEYTWISNLADNGDGTCTTFIEVNTDLVNWERRVHAVVMVYDKYPYTTPEEFNKIKATKYSADAKLTKVIKYGIPIEKQIKDIKKSWQYKQWKKVYGKDCIKEVDHDDVRKAYRERRKTFENACYSLGVDIRNCEESEIILAPDKIKKLLGEFNPDTISETLAKKRAEEDQRAEEEQQRQEQQAEQEQAEYKQWVESVRQRDAAIEQYYEEHFEDNEDNWNAVYEEYLQDENTTYGYYQWLHKVYIPRVLGY